jgi:hypothetical protein
VLVATKSFTYTDPWRGRCEVTAGVTQVREGHEPALSHPDSFKPASERDTQLRAEDSFGVNFGREAVRVTGSRASAKRQPIGNRHGGRNTATSTRLRSAPTARKPVERKPWQLDQRVERDRARMRQQRQFDKARVSDKFGPTVVTISDHLYREDVCRYIEDAMRLRDAEIGFQLFAVPQSRPELRVARIGRPAPNAIRTASSFTRDAGWDTAQLALAREQCSGVAEIGFAHSHDTGAELSDSDVSHLVSARELFNLSRYTFVIMTPGVRGWERPVLHGWTARAEVLKDTFPTGRVLVERSRVLIT